MIETQQWPFNNLPKGSIIKGVFGYEADTPITFNGPPVETIARSAILPTEKSIPAMATYYTRPSGAGILNMATNGWVCAMENKCPWGHRFDQATQKQIRSVTENVLSAMPRLPHPSQSSKPRLASTTWAHARMIERRVMVRVRVRD